MIRIGQGRPKKVERRVWMLVVFGKAELTSFTKRPNVIHEKTGKDNSRPQKSVNSRPESAVTGEGSPGRAEGTNLLDRLSRIFEKSRK